MRVYIDPSPSICQTNPAEKEEGAVRFFYFFLSFLALVNNSVNEPSILMSFSETSASNKKKTIFFPFTLTRRCGRNRDRDKKRQKSITHRTCPCLRYFLPIPKIIIKLYLISYVTFFFCFSYRQSVFRSPVWAIVRSCSTSSAAAENSLNTDKNSIKSESSVHCIFSIFFLRLHRIVKCLFLSSREFNH